MTSQMTSSPAAHGLVSDMDTTAAIAPSDRRSNVAPPTTTGGRRWLPAAGTPMSAPVLGSSNWNSITPTCGQFQRVLHRWSLRLHRSSAPRSSATIAFMASSARGDGTRMDERHEDRLGCDTIGASTSMPVHGESPGLRKAGRATRSTPWHESRRQTFDRHLVGACPWWRSCRAQLAGSVVDSLRLRSPSASILR